MEKKKEKDLRHTLFDLQVYRVILLSFKIQSDLHQCKRYNKQQLKYSLFLCIVFLGNFLFGLKKKYEITEFQILHLQIEESCHTK